MDSSQAIAWRENLRASSPLTLALASVDHSLLAEAYQLWWGTYCDGIRRAPSSLRPEGVAAADAKSAANNANGAVLNLLSESRDV